MKRDGHAKTRRGNIHSYTRARAARRSYWTSKISHKCASKLPRDDVCKRKKKNSGSQFLPYFYTRTHSKTLTPVTWENILFFFSLFQCLDETENQNEIVFFYSFLKLWDIGSHTCTKPTWIASAITIFLVFYFLVLELVTPGSYILKQNKKTTNATYQEATIFLTRIQEHSNLFPAGW